MEIDVVGLDRLVTKMQKFEKDIQNPDLSFGVRGMAKVWNDNFASEGGSVGGWRPLSAYTQKKREERGYNPQHPILVQSGALRRAVITTLMGARTARSVRADGIAMTSVYHGLSAVLNASGPKAENQTGARSDIKGQKTGTRSRIPKRPFWYVDAQVEAGAADGIQRWVTKMLGEYK